MMAGRSHEAPFGVALVGAGEFGATFAAQARRIPALALKVVCDRDRDRAWRALESGGYGRDEVADCENRAAVLRAVESGRVAVVEDYRLLADLPVACVVEATGMPEIAARVAELAIASGCHSAMVTKETEVVVGPVLARRAQAAGLVHTTLEGDQPALLIALIERARALGLPVVAAGKSSESDYVFDPAAGTVTAWGRTVPVTGYDRLFAPDDPLSALRERVVEGLPTGTVPDLCEMAIVANHCGLAIDVPPLHAPVARTVELARLFRPAGEGGLLNRTGVVDVFVCLRRPDEISFAGGVFVVVEAPDTATGRLLAEKGIPGSGDGRYLLLHNPVHLLGSEAPLSVLAACRDGRSSGGPDVRQSWDLVARAERAFAADEPPFAMVGTRHALPDVSPEIVPASALGPDAPVPYYLLPDARLVRPVASGELIRGRDVALAEDSALVRLRREQDALAS